MIGDQRRGVGFAVEDEDEVGAGVDALLEEKLEIPPRTLRFRVDIRNEGFFVARSEESSPREWAQIIELSPASQRRAVDTEG